MVSLPFLPSPIDSRTSPSTKSTMPTPICTNVQIRTCQHMADDTSRPTAQSKTIDLASLAAPNILATANWLHMTVIHTGTVAAEMVYRQIIRDRPDRPFIGQSMGKDTSRSKVKTPIATTERAKPQPTGAEVWPQFGDRSVLVNLRPEALLGCRMRMHREPPFLGAVREAAPSGAPASLYHVAEV